MSEEKFLLAGEVAEKLGVNPRDVVEAIYYRRVDVTALPIVSGKRQIPASRLAEFRRALRNRRKLRQRV